MHSKLSACERNMEDQHSLPQGSEPRSVCGRTARTPLEMLFGRCQSVQRHPLVSGMLREGWMAQNVPKLHQHQLLLLLQSSCHVQPIQPLLFVDSIPQSNDKCENAMSEKNYPSQARVLCEAVQGPFPQDAIEKHDHCKNSKCSTARSC